MVNVGKRMRQLQPLLAIRRGKGEGVLPPPPAPQLTKLHLRVPRRLWGKDVAGIYGFQRYLLPTLKYHNPGLPIEVESDQGDRRSPMTLTLQFEGPDPEALRSIAQKSSLPPFAERRRQKQIAKEASAEEQEAEAKKQSPNWRDTPTTESNESTPQSAKRSANDDEIVLKSPAGTDSPPVYTRSVTLGLRGRTTSDIWFWFTNRTNIQPAIPNPADDELIERIEAHRAEAEVDRQRVKAGVEAVRREKEDLKRAREAADQLSADAV